MVEHLHGARKWNTGQPCRGNVLGSSKCNDPWDQWAEEAWGRVRGDGRGEAWGAHHVGPEKDFSFFWGLRLKSYIQLLAACLLHEKLSIQCSFGAWHNQSVFFEPHWGQRASVEWQCVHLKRCPLFVWGYIYFFNVFSIPFLLVGSALWGCGLVSRKWPYHSPTSIPGLMLFTSSIITQGGSGKDSALIILLLALGTIFSSKIMKLDWI